MNASHYQAFCYCIGMVVHVIQPREVDASVQIGKYIQLLRYKTDWSNVYSFDSSQMELLI